MNLIESKSVVCYSKHVFVCTASFVKCSHTLSAIATEFQPFHFHSSVRKHTLSFRPFLSTSFSLSLSFTHIFRFACKICTIEYRYLWNFRASKSVYVSLCVSYVCMSFIVVVIIVIIDILSWIYRYSLYISFYVYYVYIVEKKIWLFPSTKIEIKVSR